MNTPSEHKGIAYAIANNDDGAWRWIIYPAKNHKLDLRVVPPRPVYGTRAAAVNAAKLAIDALLDKKPARTA